MEHPYLEILKKAWKATAENRFLWWYGLILGGGGGVGLNWTGDPENRAWEDKLSAFGESNPEIILLSLVLLAILAIGIIFLKIRSFAGMVIALKHLDSGTATNFRESFKSGKVFFSRILSLSLLYLFFSLILILVIAVPIVFLFFQKAYFVGGATAFFGILILILSFILAAFVERFSSFYLITGNLKLGAALVLGYRIFMKNISRSIIFSLILSAISFVLFLGLFFVLLFPAGILFAAGLVLYHSFSWPGAFFPLTLGVLTALSIWIAFRSVFGTFFHSAWYSFFVSIASVPEEDPAPVTEPVNEVLPAENV